MSNVAAIESEKLATLSEADATTAGNIAMSNTDGTGEPTTSTKVGSLADLRNKAPKVYRAMIFGIAMNICNDSKHHQDRIIEMLREERRQNGG